MRNMKRKFLFLALLSVALCLIFSTSSFAQNCRIDGFNNARADSGWSVINGPNYTALRAKLANPTYFSSSTGVVPFGIALQAGQLSVAGGVPGTPDVFITGWTTTSSFTAPELTALQNFVNGGGSLIIQADDTAHSITSTFGVTQLAVQGTTNQGILAPNHVIMNGPFGTVRTLVPNQNIGQFSVVPGDAQILATNIPASGPATAAVVVIPAGALAPGSGRVIILNDANYGSNSEPGGVHDDDVFMLNVIAYACLVPNVPGGNTLYFPQMALNGGWSTTGRVSSAFSGVAPAKASRASASGHTRVPVAGIMANFYNNTGTYVSGCFFNTSLPDHGTFSCVPSVNPANPVVTGHIEMSTDDFDPFNAQEVFNFPGATPNTAVGVGPGTPGRSFLGFGQLTPATNMGLAMFALRTNPGPATVTVRVWDSGGVQFGNTGIFNMPAGTQTALFADQAPISASLLRNTNASITVDSDQQIVVMFLGVFVNGFIIYGSPTYDGVLPDSVLRIAKTPLPGIQ